MTYYIDIQNASSESIPVTEEGLSQLAILALRKHVQKAELTIRLVDPEEMVHLNHTYRQKNTTTNVLAFPFALPDGVTLECPLLGDVVICPAVLREESIKQKKSLNEHWALILIHGVLHLLGYDHIKDEDAQIMQSIEIKLLSELGYDNPYENEEE